MYRDIDRIHILLPFWFNKYLKLRVTCQTTAFVWYSCTIPLLMSACDLQNNAIPAYMSSITLNCTIVANGCGNTYEVYVIIIITDHYLSQLDIMISVLLCCLSKSYNKWLILGRVGGLNHDHTDIVAISNISSHHLSAVKVEHGLSNVGVPQSP